MPLQQTVHEIPCTTFHFNLPVLLCSPILLVEQISGTSILYRYMYRAATSFLSRQRPSCFSDASSSSSTFGEQLSRSPTATKVTSVFCFISYRKTASYTINSTAATFHLPVAILTHHLCRCSELATAGHCLNVLTS